MSEKQKLIEELKATLAAVDDASEEEISELVRLDAEYEDYVMFVPNITENINAYRTFMPIIKRIIDDVSKEHPDWNLKVGEFTYNMAIVTYACESVTYEDAEMLYDKLFRELLQYGKLDIMVREE